ncbi:MAG TPA: class I SAM-dependent methyltransferase [Dehalococcoidia bacterium]|nr:class I SAM-dependent methyltransferase [Dehalococcoidia bacterium]
MTTQEQLKQSHAVLDQPSRESKASNIIRLIEGCAGSLSHRDVLDVGTGSGFIASALAQRAGSFLSVDVNDERLIRDFDFLQVESERLPCSDETCDVVVSNHVIEHVNDQRLHLQEVARVLRPDGLCYLATPNRWRIVEPHFKLPFLSWLPPRLRDPYVRLTDRGDWFDVQPLTYGGIDDLAASAGLTCTDLTPEMVALSLGDRVALPLRVARPAWFAIRQLLPTFVVALRKYPSLGSGLQAIRAAQSGSTEGR